MMKRNISVFSFFSGVGILDLAFEKTGFNIVWVNEYCNDFLYSYQYARQHLNIKGPIYGYSSESAEKYVKRRGRKRLLKMMSAERKKGNLVGFIGGPPCPDFSVGGKNAGRDGANGKLTKTYFDIICKCKPDFFLFENVKGLISTEKHRSFFNEMKIKVHVNGYALSEKLVNSLEYGVPQSRERIFLIGVNEELIRHSQYMLDQGNLIFNWEENRLFTIDKIKDHKWPERQAFVEGGTRPYPCGIPKKLTVEYTHANAKDVFNVKNGKSRMLSIDEGDTRGKSYKRLHRWKYSPTAAYGHNEVHLHPYYARRLSVSEAMAIQSLPRNFVLPSGISLSSKFKMIGNGVPYKLALAIAITLKKQLLEMKGNYDEKNED